MDEMVILIIKAANQSTPDQRMQCDANWSVSTLKGHLSEAHPSRPNTEEQRLIYSGQLLSDHHLLCNILRRPSEDNTYTIHLVCSPPPSSSSSSSHRQTHRHSNNNNNNNTDTNHEGPTSMAANTATPTTTTTNESTDGIRRRHPPASTAATTTTTTPTLDTSGPPPTTTTTPTLPLHAVEGVLQPSYDPIHQVAAMQQMYAQYMAYVQYSMQLSGGGLGGLAWPQQMIQIPPPPNPATATTAAATPPPPPPLPPPTTDTTDQPQQDLNQPPAAAVAAADPQPQPQQQQQQQQQQPIRMNAQGGEVVDDEDEDEAAARDWLDWVYVLCRMMVLLSIVYFYSTLSRFMVVIFIAMLLYLYQAGWFRPTRRVELPANQPQPPHAPHNQQNNNNNNNNDEQGRASEDEEEDEEEGEEELEDEVPRMEDVLRAEGSEGDETRLVVRPSFLSLSWTFLTTFFTSLIPEQPQGI